MELHGEGKTDEFGAPIDRADDHYEPPVANEV